MSRHRRKVIILCFLFLMCLSWKPLEAQQVNTLYFMTDVPVRHYLNPSFQPTNDFYLSLPVVGFTQFSAGNNSLSVKDIIYNVNEQAVTFLSPLGNINRFYQTLKPNTVMHADLQTNILSFGYRRDEAYWTFSVAEKVDGSLCLPKDVFKISLFGTPNIQTNSYNFSSLQTDVSVYTEAALGYSKKLNDKWTIGGKFKFLYGSANFSNMNNHINLQAGIENWTLKGVGSVNLSSPIQVTISPDLKTFSYISPTNVIDWLKPSGIGAGLDFGAEYHLNNINLSAALIDLGFIVWTKNIQNYQYRIDYTFNGIKQFDNSTTINTLRDTYNQLISNVLVDSLTNAFQSSVNSNLTNKVYATATTSKLNLGIEYGFLRNKLSIGLLSHTRINRNAINEELTVSANAHPYQWLNASLSSSIFNGGLSSIGAGLGLRTGFIHWFIAADYLPFQKVTLPNENISIPYNTRIFNLSVGMNIVFDAHKTKVKAEKTEIARKLGLKNRNPIVKSNKENILPDSKKIFKNRIRIDSKGHLRRKAKPDCHCDWN